MKKVLFSIMFLGLASLASAQTASPAQKLAWDQPAPDQATAQGYVFKIVADGGAATALTGVTCTGTASPFICSVPFPAFTPGRHTAQVSAGNVAGDSPLSAVFSFTFVMIPATPLNLRGQ